MGYRERREMLNCLTIVGKVVEKPIMKETSNGVKYTTLLIDCKRSFRNGNGEYEHDIMSATLWRGIAESSVNFCEKGTYVALKARIQSHPYTNEEGITYYNYDIIAERVSFLTKEGRDLISSD